MSTQYTVVKGDCLSAIAKRFGFADYRTIYNHPDNADFKELRPDPNLIYSGDILQIPDKEPGEKPGETDKKHKFRKKGKKTFLRLRILDSEDNPYANVDFELTVDGAKDKITGKTDGNGKIEEEIEADAAKGELFLKKNSGSGEVIGVIELELGELDPIVEDTGVQARLNNLGFDCGEVGGAMDAEKEEAIRAFQKKNTLTETGTADEATKNKLVEQHDWE